jgi:hypothetical protein
MKISNLTECSTTAGAVATVAQPFEAVQKREPEKKLKGSNLLKGIKTSAKYANSLHEGEGFQHDVDHMPGQTVKHQNTNCTACHGRKVQYKLGDKLHADNKKGATKVMCQTCNGTGDKEHTDTEDGRNYANAFGTYRYESVEEGAKVDRMVGHVKSSEKKLGKSAKEAENIAWATANKRGMLDNKNKKVEEGISDTIKRGVKNIKRLATGKTASARAGQEIAKSQDASMKGDHKTSKKHFDRFDKLDKLANKEQGVAEGWDSTYIVSVIDTATGERNKIEVKVTSPEAAKKRAEAQGYKVLGVKEQGVAEAKADPTGSWVVYNGSKLTKFKTREGAKAYAEKNGGTVASSEYYHDKIQKQGVAESSESTADIDKQIEFHKQGQAAAQYKGSMNKMHSAKIRELEAKKKQQGVSEGRFVKGPGGVPLDRQGNAIPLKPQAEPKAPAVRRDANGLTRADYNTVWRKIEDVVGQIFPDGDPIDWLGPWLDRQGIKDYHGGEVLNKACRLNGYKDIYAYYDHFKTDDYGYEEPVREAQQAAPVMPTAAQADPAMPAPEEPESDPELRSAEQDANIHYADAAKRKKSIEKFLLRSVKHAKEADTQQNLEIRKIKRDMDAIRQMAKAPVAEGEITEDDVVLSADRRKPKSGLLSKPEPTTNPADTVKLDVPLLIRLLEFAKEDAADDMALHDLAEKLVAGCQRGRTLTMKDYDNLVPSKQPEAPAPGEEEPEDFEGKFNQEMDEEQAVLTKPEWISKRKALQDIQMDPDVSKNPQLKRELMLKIAALKKRAEAAGLTEEELDEISEPTVKSYMKGAMRDTISGKKDRNPGIKRAVSRLAGTNKPLIQPK